MFRLFLASAILSAACLHGQIPGGVELNPAFATDGKNKFTRPILMEEIPGKPGHFLVPELASGKIWVLAPSGTSYAKTQFGQIQVNTKEEEMGLSGFAFHPDYATNRKYYVRYGDPARPPRLLHIEERLAAEDLIRDSGQPGRKILSVELPNEFSDHNGGSPVFGPDGYLYVNIGDGGWDLETPDVHKYGQNLEVLLSKILRIDVNKKDPGLEYAIPADNPFVTHANAKVRRETYAYGLRNPFRMSFDRLTGDLYAGDVGWIKFDEIDLIKKGANYGWSLKENTHCLVEGTCNGVVIENPVATMANGPAKCFVGGHVYRGDPASPFYGVYIFGDHTMQKLFAFKTGEAAPAVIKDLGATQQQAVAFTLDGSNNLYMVGYTGTVFKLDHPDLKPMATTAARPVAKTPVRGMRSMVLLAGGAAGTALPAGLSGIFEAVTPDGTRLGRVAVSHGRMEGPDRSGTALRGLSGNGIVLLKPLKTP